MGVGAYEWKLAGCSGIRRRCTRRLSGSSFAGFLYNGLPFVRLLFPRIRTKLINWSKDVVPTTFKYAKLEIVPSVFYTQILSTITTFPFRGPKRVERGRRRAAVQGACLHVRSRGRPAPETPIHAHSHAPRPPSFVLPATHFALMRMPCGFIPMSAAVSLSFRLTFSPRYHRYFRAKDPRLLGHPPRSRVFSAFQRCSALRAKNATHSRDIKPA